MSHRIAPKIAENPNVTAKPTKIKRLAEVGLDNDEDPSGTVRPQQFGASPLLPMTSVLRCRLIITLNSMRAVKGPVTLCPRRPTSRALRDASHQTPPRMRPETNGRPQSRSYQDR